MNPNEIVLLAIACLLIADIGLIIAAFLATRPRLTDEHVDQFGKRLLRLGRIATKIRSTWISGMFTADVYRDGLFIGVVPLFGLLRSNRGRFVLWEEIVVDRRWTPLGPRVELQLSDPQSLILIVPNYVADTLATVANHRWPEDGPFPVVTVWTIARQILIDWAVVTALVGVLFGIFIRLLSANMPPPIWLSFVPPGVFFGVMFFIAFVRDARALSKYQLH